MTKRQRRYRLRAYSKGILGRVYSGGYSSFYVGGRMTRKELLKARKVMHSVFPSRYRFRVYKTKGLTGISMLLGIAIFLICMALANSIDSIFNFTADNNGLIQGAFIMLGIFSLLAGVLKSQ